MKRYKTIIFIAFTGVFFTASPSFAQKNHDISVQYCLATTPEIFDSSSEIFADIFQASVQRDNIRWSGGFYGTYRYFFTGIMSVSVALGYNRIWSDLISSGELVGENIRDYYTVAAEWNIHYLRFEMFQMYSGGGLGATFVFEDNSYYRQIEGISSESKVYPNFNFTFVGVRFGGNLGGFIETGIGYKGLLAFGLSWQF
jgi:hypothetical protein